MTAILCHSTLSLLSTLARFRTRRKAIESCLEYTWIDRLLLRTALCTSLARIRWVQLSDQWNTRCQPLLEWLRDKESVRREPSHDRSLNAHLF